MKDFIQKAIYDKYILPTKNNAGNFIGAEIEMPVVNLNGEPVDEKISINTAAAFASKFGFSPESHDADGNVNSMSDSATGDILSFDCSYSNLELSFGKATDLFAIKERFERYIRFLNSEFGKYGYILTGMGVNPNADINHNKPIPNERYRMLYHYLHSYPRHTAEVEMRFHDRPDFGTFTSASQVQLDVDQEKLIDVINVIGMLEPYKSLLFANSYLPEFPEYLCVRNMLWEHSMQGYNPHNIGMFADPVRSIDELTEYIGSQSMYCVMRDGKYIDFTPVTVSRFFESDEIEGEYFNGSEYKTIKFQPELSDIEHLRTFKFEDLTFRGTIEYRSSCCQPLSEAMTVAAFHTGLNEKIYELKELLENDRVIYTHGFSAAELQKLFSLRRLPDFLDLNAASAQMIKILDLAADGLKKRGAGEETLLLPLYKRTEEHTNPARKMLDGIGKGFSIRRYIEDYSAL